MSDYDFPPKKRVTTYGRAAARRNTVRNGGSTTELSAPSTSSTTRVSSPEAPPAPRPRITTTASTSKTARTVRPARPVRSKPVTDVQSQPMPDLTAMEDGLEVEDVKSKRRKLTRTYSERKADLDDMYDMPDSPPPPTRVLARKSPPKAAQDNPKPRAARVAKPVLGPKITPEKEGKKKDTAVHAPFSATTSRYFDKLSVSSDAPNIANQAIPLRPSREPVALSRPAAKKRPSPPLASKPIPSLVSKPVTQPAGSKPSSAKPALSRPKSTSAPAPRRRLIDALVEQEESEEEEEETWQPSQQPVTEPPQRVLPEFTFRDSPPPSQEAPRSVARGTKKKGPKFTYSQQRTMLLEEDEFMGGGGLGGIEESLNGGMFNFGRLAPVSRSTKFSFLDEVDETTNTGAVKSLHELRQAGANSRFADEMDDIMDRIGTPSGKPSPLRRGALLELAQRMNAKEFRRQFRNHNDDGGLVKSLGQETDLISGYSILAILVTLLSASSSAHLVQLLRAQGFASLLARMLEHPTDIVVLAKDRKQNASKNAQTTLASIKASLLSLPIWEPCAPKALSPRTLGLKCLDLIMHQPSHSAGETEILTPAVTSQLFAILSTGASDEACWDFPTQPESADFYLALYTLEGYSVNAMQSDQGATWTREHVPVVVDILDAALRRPAETYGDLESLTLRITLNTTNHNPEAAAMFENHLRAMADSACRAFATLLGSTTADTFQLKVNESVILMLGVMINLCVYYPPASQGLEEKATSANSPLDQLIRIFADNHAKTSDADSMEKTQLNVALGYLAVLLGNLCLRPAIRDRFLTVHPKKNIQPLIDSINEFVAFHSKVAEAEGTSGGSQAGAVARLRDLAEQLYRG
ncbi:wings apart-like protein 1 [Podospora conica]|nr:wings apart-like protein 1 [Schizothecium conicum]